MSARSVHRIPRQAAAGRILALGGGLGLALAAGAVAPVRADNPTLNISPGLWEITMQTQGLNQLPIPEDALAKMTPDQRAKVEAAMQAAMAHAARPHRIKECITAERIRRGLSLGPAQRQSCTQTVLSSSPTLMAVREVCTGAHPMTTTIHVEAPDPHTMHASNDMTVTHGTQTMNVKGKMDATWLAADCGGVSPDRPQME